MKLATYIERCFVTKATLINTDDLLNIHMYVA